ncbi:MAG: membrane protein insertion efficiency factor YidD [Acidobacteria bacterium]|nr:membrane protein insertion efficiency factor YidD [Acidobacteriota bacterium]
MTQALQFMLKLYRMAVSPWLPPACKYWPTCSNYASEAIERHGLVRGSAMAMWRLVRCNPVSPGGYDPVK